MGQITFTDLLSQETKRDPVAFSARLREQGSLIHLTSPSHRRRTRDDSQFDWQRDAGAARAS